MSIVYSVTLKSAVKDLLANANDLEFSQYVADNINLENGQVYFYSNAFTPNAAEGKTTVEFTPAPGNPSYYITEDTVLYEDAQCTIPATDSVKSGQTYYYKLKHYDVAPGAITEGNLIKGTAVEDVSFVSVTPKDMASHQKANNIGINAEDNTLFFKAGTLRFAHINDFNKDKANNITGTATQAMDCEWNNVAGADDKVIAALGNNGRLGIKMSSSLTVSKAVATNQNVAAPDIDFTFKTTFTNSLNKPLAGDIAYQVTNTETNAVVSTGTVTLDTQGKASVACKANEQITFTGLTVGTKYKVEEAAQAGFVPAVNGVAGAIATGEVSSTGATVAFTNTFKHKVVLGAELVGSKTISGRDWKATDEFTFVVTPDTATAQAISNGDIVPSGVLSKTVASIDALSGDKVMFTLDDIAINKPGVYSFAITEKDGGMTNAGLNYDDSTYILTITASASAEAGEWDISKQIQKVTPAGATNVTAFDFVNEYSPNDAAVSIDLAKTIEGRQWNETDEFAFTLKPSSVNADAPMPTDTVEGVKTVVANNADAVSFGDITFTKADLNGLMARDFKYVVSEVIPEPVPAYMAYASDQEITVTVTDLGDGTLTATVNPATIAMKNTYNATTTVGQTGGLGIIKKVEGHNFVPNKFNFKVETTDPVSAAKAQELYPREWTETGMVVTASVADENGDAAVIPLFNDLAFTSADVKAGTVYTYTISEVKPDGYTGEAYEGYTYDSAVHTVSFRAVADDGQGNLTIEITLDNDTYQATNIEGQRVAVPIFFTNTYEASGTINIDVDKSLTGRAMDEGEFTFNLKLSSPDVSAPDVVLATAKNAASAAGEPARILFDSITITKSELDDYIAKGYASVDAAGEHMTLYVDIEEGVETLPAGVVATLSSIKFNVSITDNGDGTLTCTPNYPDGMTLANAYNTDTASINLNGQKVVRYPDGFNLELNQANIMNAFDFTLKAVTQGAPMPATNEQGVSVVKMDRFGNVDFGAISFTYEDLKDVDVVDGKRIKTFTYEVTESGSYPGVTNNADNPTVRFDIVVTAIEGENGTITAVCRQAPVLFKFVNLYEITNPVTSTLSFDKVLNGREIVEGEFTFNLVDPHVDSINNVIATGEVDASGHVELSNPITFTKPGTYKYILAENKKNPLAGVTYDTIVYDAVAVVTDNLESGLDIAWTLSAPGLESQNLTLKSVKSDGTKVFGPEGALFSNSYASTGDTSAIGGFKQLNGRDWKSDETFTFDLAPYGDETIADVSNGTVVMPTSSVTITGNDVTGVKLNGGVYGFSFGKLTVNKPGTYTFLLSEASDGTATDVVMDTSQYVVTVVATENQPYNGKLKLAVQYAKLAEDGSSVASDSAKFVNKFVSAPIDATLMLNKTFEGRAWNENDVFTFMLTSLDGAPVPANSVVSVGAPETGKTVNFTMGPIRFTEALLKGQDSKTFNYLLKEIDGQAGGVEYDETYRNVAITVTRDSSTGLLSHSVSVTGGNGVNFVNNYKANTGYAGIEIVKTLTGHSMDAGQFKFVVAPADANAIAKSNGEPMVALIPRAADGHATVKVMDSLKFDQNDAGKTFTYTITEDTSNPLPGYTYDDTSYEVAITVNDSSDGTLTTSTTVNGAPVEGTPKVEFNNSYLATTPSGPMDMRADIQVTKTLRNHKLAAGDFTFNLLDANGNVVQGGVTNDDNGVVDFAPISYSSDEIAVDPLATKVAEGVYEYTYTVEENINSLANGITPTHASEIVKVKVTDLNNGTLKTDVVYAGEGSSVNLINTYKTSDTSLVLSGIKTLNLEDPFLGMTLDKMAGKFTFTLTPKDNAPMPAGVSAVAVNDAIGSFSFGEFEFTFDDLQGQKTKQYVYEVVESVTSGVDASGFSIDSTVHPITVTLTDLGDGTMKAEASMDGSANVTFTNKYSVAPKSSSPTTDGGIVVTKRLENRELKADEFSFELKDANGIVLQTKKNSVDGLVEFDPITFKAPGEYVFTVNEKAIGDKHIAYDSSSYTFVAKVFDNDDGTLGVEWLVENSESMSIDFVNVYTPEKVTIDPKVHENMTFTKEVVGRDWLDNETFTFTLYDTNASKSLVNDSAYGRIIEQVEVLKPEKGNKAEFEFSPLYFGLADLTKTATEDVESVFTYVVAESVGTAGGMSYDLEPRYVTIKVSYDYATGVMKAELLDITSENGNDENFVNSYTAAKTASSPTGEGNLVINKTLNGRDLRDGEFSFTLKNNLGQEVETVTNAANGEIKFGELLFNEAGTYTYTVVENAKKDVTSVTFDKTAYKVQAVVVDNLDGTLKVTWNNVDGAKDITFVNTYEVPKPEPTLPKTNDSSLGGIVAGLALVSACIMMVLVRRLNGDKN